MCFLSKKCDYEQCKHFVEKFGQMFWMFVSLLTQHIDSKLSY